MITASWVPPLVAVAVRDPRSKPFAMTWSVSGTRSNSHSVAARSSCTNIPLASGEGSGGRTSYEDGCVKPVLLSAGRHRPFLRVLASVGAEVELRAARGALANLVSGGTGSAPRSLIRVGGAPRRAAPLYCVGAARQPTSHHGRRSLGPTGPAPLSKSGPILSVGRGSAGACAS